MSTKTKGPRAQARRHDWIDERNRALHTEIAHKVRCDPSLLRIALDNLNRWERLRGSHPTDSEWRAMLDLPLDELLAFLTEDSERADRLRQSTPFAGVLTQEERMTVVDYYETL